MSRVVLCGDGIEMALESESGFWVVLRKPEGDLLGRFPLDACELHAISRGAISFQASDGNGHSVGIYAYGGGLRVRLEARGHAAKNCQLPSDRLEEALCALKVGV